MLTGLALLISGCGSSPTIAPGRYAGPDIRLEPGTRDHVVVVTAPSPGWDVSFDHSQLGPEGHELFVSLRKPDPRFLYTQQIVEQRVVSDVEQSEPAAVFARTLEARERRSDEPYREATSTRADDPR